ncbi:MAG: hypothetical protein JW751_08500 [Polyangiaceae bacterium]|nr:hypothetical protein [Polyangiaceae bacterium]
MLLVFTLLCVTAPGFGQPRPELTRAAVEVVLVGKVGQEPAFPWRVTSWFDPGGSSDPKDQSSR